MAQRSETRDLIPGEIAKRILNEVRPWRIVLFGSRARGDAKDESDYDIYLEIDGTDETLSEIQSRVRSVCRGIGCELDIHARRPGHIERRRDDPGTIEWDVAREGRLLYADPSAPTITVAPRRVSESPANPPESALEWLETAERDIRHWRVLLDSGDDFSPDICWLAQQTSEKHMKALLISRWVRPRRTHDLSELLEELRVTGCDLAGLDADCALLTKHAIKPRYPGSMLGPDEARIAIDAATRVVEAVKLLLPPG